MSLACSARASALVIMVGCVLALPLRAEESPKQPPETAGVGSAALTSSVAALTSGTIGLGRLAGLPHPPLPALGADDRDWIRLKSGEWLMGTLQVWRDFTVAFRSEKLKDQTFDDKDVSDAAFPRDYTFVFKNPDSGGLSTLWSQARFITVHGPGVVGNGEVTVRTAEGDRRFARDDLVAVVADVEESELSKWHVRLSLGVNSSMGNSRTQALTALANLTRESTATRLVLSYSGAYGRDNYETTDNFHRGETGYDVFLSQRLYLTPFTGSAVYDFARNIALQTVGGGGFGLRIIQERWGNLRVGSAAGYGRTRFIEVENPDDEVRGEPLVLLSVEWDFDITKRLSVSGKYSLQLAVANLGNTTHHLETTISWKLTDDLITVEFSTIFDRVEDPAQLPDGSSPQPNDVRFLISLGVRF